MGRHLSADTCKKIFDLDGSTPEHAIRSGDTGQRIPFLTAVNWSQHWCAIEIWLESVRIKRWLPCGANRRAGGRCTVTWLPNFLGWVDLLTQGAPQARFARQSSAVTNILCQQLILHIHFNALFLVDANFLHSSLLLTAQDLVCPPLERKERKGKGRKVARKKNLHLLHQLAHGSRNFTC